MTVVTVIRFVTNPGKNLLARRPHGSVKQSHGASEFKQMTKGFVELVHEIEAEPVERRIRQRSPSVGVAGPHEGVLQLGRSLQGQIQPDWLLFPFLFFSIFSFQIQIRV
jgi:hypothetical protein